MARTARKPWTVLIYMVADDPQGGELLDQQAVREMDEITKAALSVQHREDLHVAIQVDFRTLPGVWRRVIGESTFVRPEGNAAHPATLYGFFDWAATECPAEHYLLIFWGHSRGQFGMFGDSDPFDYTAQTLTLDELRDALTAAKRSLGKPMDVIAFKDCFMATLETAYELTGLADYLLASPSLVPVEDWPYQTMFESLANKGGLDAAKGVLDALEKHYEDKDNTEPFEEVPYSLLSTMGAEAVVKQWEALFGKGHTSGLQADNAQLRSQLLDAASRGGDPALVDLGVLVPEMLKNTPRATPGLVSTGEVAGQAGKLETTLDELAVALGNASPAAAAPAAASAAGNPATAGPEKLVIRHTGGKKFGGVSVFVYPSSPRAQRESRLTRLADEKVYRRLAISTDTNWADIALQNMPLQRAQPDVSNAIAVLEQLQRLGVGMAPGSAARATGYLRRIARRSGYLTDAEVAEAAEYAAIAELAARLASFAAAKGGDGFAKGGDGFAKGGDGFAKGGDGFAKGGDGFVS